MKIQDKNQYVVDDIDFTDDINSFDKQIMDNEKLYEEVHTIFEKIVQSTTKGGIMGQVHQIKDIAEIGKTLASVRSTSIQGVNQRFTAKKTISELKMKRETIDRNIENGDEISLARSLVKAINEEKQSLRNSSKSSNNEREKLDKVISENISKGNIKLTKNDMAMKYDFNGIVDYVYDSERDIFLAKNKQTGEIIQNYPLERIPKMRVVEQNGSYVITDNGLKIEIVN